ncbi:MAG TPA: hypothetical protein VLV78_08505 [Thermoanaerobaculia bacterium]|nr:hypothetical protein [Thermoanaerobaculia bacterium]
MARTEKKTPTHRLHLRVAGWIQDNWSEQFEGIAVRHADDGSTVLCGELKDQSALFGILHAIENRGMKLIACFAYPGGVA